MAKILKNNTVSDISVKSIGVTLPASSSTTIDVREHTLLASVDSIAELTTPINAGDIIVNDGLRDLSAADGLRYIAYPDDAFNIRFLNDPDRANAFNSRNVQEAIEEARTSGIGSVIPFVFSSSGNTADKWLEYTSSSAPSNEVPLLVPQNADIKGFTFSNKDDDVDIDVEIYCNGTLVYTWEVRNKRTYYETGISAGSLLQGDRLSVFFKRYSGGTGDDTAQTPILTVLIKFTAEAAGSGGTQHGV